ncbi:MAG TPA: ROK family protein [Burkholderiaceae bacterium]|nr:ROK family protein [Burkholderiaceae bacterium]
MRIGIDLGGTKIEIAVLDGAGTIVHRARVPTPVGDYAATLTAIARLVADAEQMHGRAQGIGVGTPGSISRSTGCIKNSNSVCLNGRNLRADLQALLRRELRIANDANCFALSEATDGAGAGSAIVFGVILGTGVGGGLVVNGHLLDGPNGITGEWGHNPLVLDAQRALAAPRACYCGRVGCVETVLSGPAMAADHALASGAPAQVPLTAEQIAQCARAGERSCIRTLERYAMNLAQALAVVINIVDPDVVILGGGISNIDPLYELVPAHWAKWIFSDQVQTRLVRNQHGDSSGVRGAAWLTA